MQAGQIKLMLKSAFSTYKRFPLLLSISIIASFVYIYIIRTELVSSSPEFRYLISFVLMSILSIPLLLTVYFTGLKYKLNNKSIWLANLIVVVLLSFYYFFYDTKESYFIRFFIFFIVAHLALTISAFNPLGEQKEFWQFNKSLLIKIITSLFFTHVLFLGISLALLAIKNLFKIEMNNRIHVETYILLLGVFNTWYFLSTLPKENILTEDDEQYPKVLKTFVIYTLIPLLMLYIVILYAYSIKIIINWSLPVGWVSSLILFYSVVGILAYLLVYPLKDDSDKSWVRTFSKWFFIFLIPLVFLLFTAVFRRISEYGITESRYIIVVLGIWLICISLYFIITKAKRISVIPLTLTILGLIITLGPWNMFNISEKSQTNRLISLLKSTKIINNGKIQKPEKISGKELESIKSIYIYLNRNHGFSYMTKSLTEISDYKLNKSADLSNINTFYNSLMIDSTMRANSTYKRYSASGYFRELQNEVIDIKEYDDLLLYELKLNSQFDKSFNLSGKKLKITFDNFIISYFMDKDTLGKFDLKNKFNSLRYKDESILNQNDMVITFENEKIKSTLLFEEFFQNTDEDTENINGYFHTVNYLKIK